MFHTVVACPGEVTRQVQPLANRPYHLNVLCGRARDHLRIMTSRRLSVAVAIFALLATTALGTAVLRAGARSAERAEPIVLEDVVPKHFGAWHALPDARALIVNPQTQQILDKIYSQMLARTYSRGSDERVMLSIAYGSDQRGELQAHKPEVCYPAQGFNLLALQPGQLTTAYGDIRVTRLDTVAGARREHVTYWLTSGDSTVVSALDRRIQEIRFALTGRIPDGLLFRVSAIGPDAKRAEVLQEDFVRDLLAAVTPATRQRLSGLAAATP